MTSTAHIETPTKGPEPFRSPVPRVRALLQLIDSQATPPGPIAGHAREWLKAYDALAAAIDRTDRALVTRSAGDVVDQCWADQNSLQDPLEQASNAIAHARPASLAEAALKLQVVLDMECVEALENCTPLLTVVDDLTRLAAH